ncbi:MULTISPECIES: GNAT family N-acetyltransferase [Brevibacillus]|uniref:GNAT family N-acetyltransferase n=1 Tax=Brevibacillus TaxID=55080 RepID=UPI001C8F129C|nr:MULTISPECIES: GNAT family N-acetyltransferase [Brevibacillus]MBY0087723.1 GNAT family N-acetyltransferase [Brevibacillus brevis]MCE0448764.1 GNAT family N-acetyltransferase [Brevibacillus sp. AF8]UKK98948.1 GNAT family N-acetyltransferase [Brevibacillus brevis]
MHAVLINLPIHNNEVPDLRELVGWERRDGDFPTLLERCNYWAGLRDENGTLIAFGYVCGTGLLHGYMEDLIVHPDHQKQGVGVALVKKLLEEAERTGLGIVTVTYASEHTEFYKKGGFTACPGGLWRK